MEFNYLNYSGVERRDVGFEKMGTLEWDLVMLAEVGWRRRGMEMNPSDTHTALTVTSWMEIAIDI